MYLEIVHQLERNSKIPGLDRSIINSSSPQDCDFTFTNNHDIIKTVKMLTVILSQCIAITQQHVCCTYQTTIEKISTKCTPYYSCILKPYKRNTVQQDKSMAKMWRYHKEEKSVCLSIEAPEKVRSVGQIFLIFFCQEKSAWKQIQQRYTTKNVGTEVFQDSENTQIHMGTGNISQISDIYFVNEFFIQTIWEFLVKREHQWCSVIFI